MEKLHAAGQLRPGYLVRALQRGPPRRCSPPPWRTLGGCESTICAGRSGSDRPELLALACAAVGIDRSVFPTLLGMVRQLNAGRPAGGAEGARGPPARFGPVGAEIAGAAFRQAAAAAV